MAILGFFLAAAIMTYISVVIGVFILNLETILSEERGVRIAQGIGILFTAIMAVLGWLVLFEGFYNYLVA